MLKYSNYTISWQEIPNEVSLAFNLSLCPGRCEGCHSPELQRDIGEPLTVDKIVEVYNKYKRHITVISFFGGDNDVDTLIDLVTYIKSNFDIKVSVYSGLQHNIKLESFELLDYLKLGPYVKALGPLNSKNTNQRFYIRHNGILEDNTFIFNNMERNKNSF